MVSEDQIRRKQQHQVQFMKYPIKHILKGSRDVISYNKSMPCTYLFFKAYLYPKLHQIPLGFFFDK